MKTPKSYKPTHDDLFLHPYCPHIIFGHFIVVSHQYGQKILKTKVHDPKLKNLLKIETNPRLLHFSPKSFAHNFRSFCCYFRSIRLKNKSVKSLDHFDTKIHKSYKPTRDDFFLHPNHSQIIFGHFIVVSHQYG